jgi:cell division protein FtsB
MTTRGPATPNRRNSARRTPAPPTSSPRRGAASGAVRRDGRSSSARVRPNRAATPRPAIRRTTSGTPAGSATSRFAAGAGRLNVTTRAALLALTLCLVALTMAYPLRAYLTQKAQISDLRTQQNQDQQAVTDLQRTVDRYRNPVSVQDEARVRLHYQLPGEKIYYLPPAPTHTSTSNEKVHTPAVPGKDDQPWYSQLWGSAVETSK